MCRAQLLHTGDSLLIYALRCTKAGLWLSVEPFSVLAAEARSTEIGNAILFALENSSGVEPEPTDWKAISQRRLSASGFKTEAALMRGSRLLSIDCRDEVVNFKPTHNGGSKGNSRGFQDIESEGEHTPYSAHPDHIGNAALATLRRCTSEA
jgi:hypothetical protein